MVDTISTLPTAPARTDTPAVFVTRADAWNAAIGVLGTELNISIPQMNALEVAGTLSEVQDTSTSSNAVGTGAKTFTITAGKSFVAGMTLTISDTAAPNDNHMVGVITSYSGTTLGITMNSSLGSGTKTAWTIYQSPTDGSASVVPIGAILALNTFSGGL